MQFNPSHPRTLDDVISYLDQIIQESKLHNQRIGYFAALYRQVTLKVKHGVNNHYFDDGPRMAALDVKFARRYFTAYEQYKNGLPMSLSWYCALNANSYRWPIVLQHLLLGINAHINLDLGIVAAEICPGERINTLFNDFNKVNNILASLINDVENKLADIWPSLSWLDRLGGRTDEMLINFSIDMSRMKAWELAQELAFMQGLQKTARIQEQDQKIYKQARRILYPGLSLGLATQMVRWGEKGTPAQIIDILSQNNSKQAALTGN